ncbi:MAG: carboxymuconolactone decarboxylase family protein [Chloroflexota bacterium]
MAQSPQSPLASLEKLDPELFKAMQQGRQFALGDGGALPKKYKLLIAVALDAAHGSPDGVRNLAQQAMKEGATKQELADTLRVVHYIFGGGAIHVAARGLQGVF